MVQESGGVSINGNPKGNIIGGSVKDSTVSYTEQVGTPSETEQATVKDAIAELQKTINADKILADYQKENLLEQVTVLAKAIEQPKAQNSKNKAAEAKSSLTSMIKMLPKAAEAVTAVGNLLPLIAQFFGFSE
jgi:hypothetical protein